MRKVFSSFAFASFLLVVTLTGCGDGGGAHGNTTAPASSSAPPATSPTPAPTSPSSANGIVTYASIPSGQTGITYGLTIYLPPGYGQGNETYPVVYVADGDYRVPRLIGAIDQARTKIILVGISCVNADRRWVDYTMPGAANYYRFVTLELVPFIEAQYRVDTRKRMLSGHSLSGNFVAYALTMENPGNRYFLAYLSGDGAYWYQRGTFDAMEQQMYNVSHDLPVIVVMAGAENGTSVTSVAGQLAGRHYGGLNLKYLNYVGWEHSAMDGPSFNESLLYALQSAG